MADVETFVVIVFGILDSKHGTIDNAIQLAAIFTMVCCESQLM